MKLLGPFVLGFVGVTGCAGAAASGAGAAAPTQSASAAETANADNVAWSTELTAAVVKAKSCELTDDGFDNSCEGYSQWNEGGAIFEEGKANAALLSMLKSADAKERLLAVEKLRTTLEEENTDVAAVDKLLAAAEKEAHPVIAKTIAEVIAELPLTKVGRIERAIQVSKAHPVSDYAENFLGNVASHNQDPKLLPYALELSRADSSSWRNAALSALAKLARSSPDQSCAALDTLRSDKSAFVANRALAEIGRARACVGRYDNVLKSLANQPIDKDTSQEVGIALDAICDDQATSTSQRDRAGALARKISNVPSAHANVRFFTISAVLKCDPKAGPAFVATFKTSANKTLANRAAALLDAKK